MVKTQFSLEWVFKNRKSSGPKVIGLLPCDWLVGNIQKQTVGEMCLVKSKNFISFAIPSIS